MLLTALATSSRHLGVAAFSTVAMTTRTKSITGHENVPRGQAAAVVHGALTFGRLPTHGQKGVPDLKVVGQLYNKLSIEEMARFQVLRLCGTMAHKDGPGPPNPHGS